MKIWIIILLLPLAGCVTTSQQQSPQSDQKPRVQSSAKVKGHDRPTPQPKVAQQRSSQVSPNSGSPVAAAQQTIVRSSREAAALLALIRSATMGDVFLPCGGQSAASFEYLQKQFGSSRFQYDQHTFWFLTIDGQEVGPFADHGPLDHCVYGLFPPTSRVRLTAFQKDAQQQPTRTEYYIDPRNWNMIVHRQHDNGELQVEEYQLVR